MDRTQTNDAGFSVLRGLYLAVGAEGIWKFCADWIGAHHHEAVEWSQRVGAIRTAEYLAAAEGVFPEGQVPRDEICERQPNPFRALDRQYKQAVDEIPERLLEYIRTHPEEYATAILPGT